jgi:hypothetical protein
MIRCMLTRGSSHQNVTTKTLKLSYAQGEKAHLEAVTGMEWTLAGMELTVDLMASRDYKVSRQTDMG